MVESKKFLRFPRDENGKLDLKNGSYSTEDVQEMKVKFDKEGRFAFGCGVREKDGVREGVRAKPFVYSNKTIKTIKSIKRLIKIFF